ncbi:MAG TPA: NADH-quinone oxidoreductase subunit J [Myxococcaceae bacterium]|nr:NADH-quinone oxidoreductase subunit J [Myxococcaceae bacterium]
MSVEVLLFWVFAFSTVLGATFVVAARSAMYCAMALVATFFFLAAIYVLLWAHTIAILQVLVYAGAIMVLFLFVIMLLSLDETGLPRVALSFSRVIGAAATLGLLVLLVIAIGRTRSAGVSWSAAQQASFGTIRALGQILYTDYLLPFEAVSLLLLVAIVGAVVVAKPRI